ncbi:MAG: bifunctional riboflavin kinase/FMN adenylyltransferase, partial [Chloroflexota bacterium]|nr:bifunctional riboflavin kinase/FMN adenylyltransferase [Chloroflexota bacterium]
VLSAYCQRRGIAFVASSPFAIDGHVVSSTTIRRLLAGGDVEGAAKLLGRNPSVGGRVVKGDRRGRRLGFPTANLEREVHHALPADGIYVAYTEVQGRRLRSAVNVGVRPTFDASRRTVESYVLDFDGDLYGQTIAIEFLHRLRPEQKFDSVEALREQMARDVEQTREYFSGAAARS